MIDPEDVDYNQSCPKCVHVVDLNEALIEENERLRDHMESMIVLVQKFEADKAQLTSQNDAKISALEREVDFLQKEKENSHTNTTRDH